jgi:hypothetical protein
VAIVELNRKKNGLERCDCYLRLSAVQRIYNFLCDFGHLCAFLINTNPPKDFPFSGLGKFKTLLIVACFEQG